MQDNVASGKRTYIPEKTMSFHSELDILQTKTNLITGDAIYFKCVNSYQTSEHSTIIIVGLKWYVLST